MNFLLPSGCTDGESIEKSVITKIVGFWPLGLGLLIVCTFGLVGNILSAIVLRSPRMNSTYSTLTLWLTLVDTVYLLCKLFFYGFTSLFEELFTRSYYNHFLFPFFGPKLRAVTFTTQTASTYLTVVLAIDRYISICWPFTVKTLWTKKIANLAASGVVVFASLYNIPRWMEMETKKRCEEEDFTMSAETNGTYEYFVIVPSPLRQNADYRNYYTFWAYFFVLNLIPFVSLSFFNFSIFRAVRKAAKIRSSLTSQQKTDISFAFMLLTIVLVYLICNSVFLITDILTYFEIKYKSYWYSVGNILLTINSSVNFLIYCGFGRNFREQFRQTFSRADNLASSSFGTQKTPANSTASSSQA